ncbi:hypothetical protein AB4230_05015 [Vibrio cyclitrophicus]
MTIDTQINKQLNRDHVSKAAISWGCKQPKQNELFDFAATYIANTIRSAVGFDWRFDCISNKTIIDFFKANNLALNSGNISRYKSELGLDITQMVADKLRIYVNEKAKGASFKFDEGTLEITITGGLYHQKVNKAIVDNQPVAKAPKEIQRRLHKGKLSLLVPLSIYGQDNIRELLSYLHNQQPSCSLTQEMLNQCVQAFTTHKSDSENTTAPISDNINLTNNECKIDILKDKLQPPYFYVRPTDDQPLSTSKLGIQVTKSMASPRALLARGTSQSKGKNVGIILLQEASDDNVSIAEIFESKVKITLEKIGHKPIGHSRSETFNLSSQKLWEVIEYILHADSDLNRVVKDTFHTYAD